MLLLPLYLFLIEVNVVVVLLKFLLLLLLSAVFVVHEVVVVVNILVDVVVLFVSKAEEIWRRCRDKGAEVVKIKRVYVRFCEGQSELLIRLWCVRMHVTKRSRVVTLTPPSLISLYH